MFFILYMNKQNTKESGMSLQKYVAFLKTVELGSISLAAEQMGYTQSAVSRMILDLEKEWGMELLHRSRALRSARLGSICCRRFVPSLRTARN